jgi:hypothetical protein
MLLLLLSAVFTPSKVAHIAIVEREKKSQAAGRPSTVALRASTDGEGETVSIIFSYLRNED